MERLPVYSSAIQSIGYDPEQQLLEIEFQRGAVYRYYDVPPEIHQALITAESIGRYYEAEVRGSYRFERVS